VTTDKKCKYCAILFKQLLTKQLKVRKDTLREVLWKIPRIKTFDELITWLKIEICYYGNKEAKIKEVEK
jgi:hypothetical protein